MSSNETYLESTDSYRTMVCSIRVSVIDNSFVGVARDLNYWKYLVFELFWALNLAFQRKMNELCYQAKISATTTKRVEKCTQ